MIGRDRIKKNLDVAGLTVNMTTKQYMQKATDAMRDRAKLNLAESSIAYISSKSKTGHSYWTGKLQRNIRSEIVDSGKNHIKTSVGVDLDEVEYAEWVELGHRTGIKHQGAKNRYYIKYKKKTSNKKVWWEGYHYLERAFLELAPKMTAELRKSINVEFEQFTKESGVMKTDYGRLTKGNFIIK